MKLLKTLFIAAICLVFFSCGDEEADYTIPWSEVNFQINLNSLDKDLNAGGAWKIFTTPRLASDICGYSGLLVLNSGLLYEDNYTSILYAYDICCPYEKVRSTVVAPSEDGITAQCPKCKTVYQLLNNGRVQSGVGSERLQPYRVYFDRNSPGIYRILN